MRRKNLKFIINDNSNGLNQKKTGEKRTTKEHKVFYVKKSIETEKMKKEIEIYRRKIAETYLNLKKEYDEKLVMSAIKRNEGVKKFYSRYFQKTHSSIERFIMGCVSMYLIENNMEER